MTSNACWRSPSEYPLVERQRIAIDDEDDLYRRLAPSHINPDGTVNSSAFKRGKGYELSISVDLARLTTARESVDRAGRSGFKLGVLQAAMPRSLGLEVNHDPLPHNESHSLIEGHNDRERSLARSMVLVPDIESRDQR